VCTYETLVCT